MPSLEKVQAAYDERDLKVLLINVGEDREKVARFMASNGYTNTVLIDKDGEAAAKYQAIGIPISFLISRKGEVASRLVGYVDWGSSRMKQAVDKLVKER